MRTVIRELSIVRFKILLYCFTFVRRFPSGPPGFLGAGLVGFVRTSPFGSAWGGRNVSGVPSTWSTKNRLKIIDYELRDWYEIYYETKYISLRDCI